MNIKVESFKIKGWKEKETGVVISENENWILVNHIPGDYLLDGFKLYQKKYVKKRINGPSEKKIERVLNLKNKKLPELKDFKFNDVIETLKWSEEKYGLFEFQDKEESDLFFGKINRVEDDILIIDIVWSDGEIEEDYDCDFTFRKIRSITFETDYFNSIGLLMKDELKKQLKVIK